MSTSDRVRYIHSLWRHISSTVFRLLGLLPGRTLGAFTLQISPNYSCFTHEEIVRLISLAPLLLTLEIRIMSLKRKRQRSFLRQRSIFCNEMR